jgi:ferredoxin
MAEEPRVDRDRCIGSGNCVFWAPATFDLDEEGKSVVIDAHGDSSEAISNAVDGCPTQALSIILGAAGDAEDPGEPDA